MWPQLEEDFCVSSSWGQSWSHSVLANIHQVVVRLHRAVPGTSQARAWEGKYRASLWDTPCLGIPPTHTFNTWNTHRCFKQVGSWVHWKQLYILGQWDLWGKCCFGSTRCLLRVCPSWLVLMAREEASAIPEIKPGNLRVAGWKIIRK